MTGLRSGAGRPAGAGVSRAGSSSAPGCPASSLSPTSSSMGLLADQRSSRPSPAPARTQMAITMAASAAKEPVTRSCAYGGRENPTAVSHPMTPRGIAATGSATKDHAVTTAAAATSTPVAVNRPCRAAATVPLRNSAAKPVTNAKGAAIPYRVEPFISLTVERPAGAENKDLDGSLTRRSAVLTPPLRPWRTAALSVGGERQMREPQCPVMGGGKPRPACGWKGKEPGGVRNAAGLLGGAPGRHLPETFWVSV